jgi:hypothetical protein
LSLSLETFRFKRRVNNHGFSSCCHRLGVSGALGHVGGADLSRSFGQHVEAVEVLSGGETTFARFSLSIGRILV